MRFPSFTDRWAIETIGHFFSLETGITPKTTENDLYCVDGIPWVNSGELQSMRLSSVSHRLPKNTVKELKMKVFPTDTLVMAIYGLEAKGVRGKSSFLGVPACISQSCMAFLPKADSIDVLFFYFFLKAKKDILGVKYAQGTKQQNLTSGLVETFRFCFPSLKEQRRIGFLLELIERRIEAQSKIIGELISLRKASLEGIFGTERFGSTMHPLSDYLEMVEQKREPRPDRQRLITVKLNEAGVVKNSNVETLKMSGTVYFQRRSGQFIYGKQNLFHGAFGIIPDSLDGFSSSGDVPTLSIRESVNQKMLLRALSFSAYSWEKYALGTGSKRIHESQLLKLQIPMPDCSWIISCDFLLSSIENRIDRERRALSLLQKQREYLLTKMFI